jgi:hypothetical protein
MLRWAIGITVFLATTYLSVANAEIDKDTLARAEVGFAAEVYGLVSRPLSEKLSKRDLDQESRDKLIFTSISYITTCVISDIVANPIPRSEDFIRALANLPDDITVREALRLKYGDDEAKTLWLNVEYVLDRCLGRTFELLGLTDA